MNTAYLPLQTLNRAAPDYIGGICRWWYTPIQNILEFPEVHPETQQLDGEPVLKPGATWYGPVNIPDHDRGWKQEQQTSKAGNYYKQRVNGFIPGNNINSYLNLLNLAYHQLCVVAKLRSGGFYIILGNQETGMRQTADSQTGDGQFSEPGTAFSLNWEGDALVLPSFNNQPSQQPNNNMASEVEPVTYTSTGAEGTTTVIPEIAGKRIIWIEREDRSHDVVSTPPAVREVQRIGLSSSLTWLLELGEGEKIKILYK